MTSNQVVITVGSPATPTLSISKDQSLNGSTSGQGALTFTPTGGSGTTLGYYTLNPSATGALGVGDSITVTDPLPTLAGLTYTGYTDTGAASALTETCTPSSLSGTSGTVSCTFTNNGSTVYALTSSSLGTITIDFSIANDAAPGTITNTAYTAYGTTATSATTGVVTSNQVVIRVVAAPITRVSVVSSVGIVLKKFEASGSPDPITHVGQVITYDFDVTNTGTVTIDHLSITDTQSVPGEALTGPVSCPVSSLAPNASVTCTGTYVVTSVDITNGNVTDTGGATAVTTTGIPVSSNPSTVTVPVTVPVKVPVTSPVHVVKPITKSSKVVPTPVKLVTGPPTPPSSTNGTLPVGLSFAGLGIAGLSFLGLERKRRGKKELPDVGEVA